MLLIGTPIILSFVWRGIPFLSNYLEPASSSLDSIRDSFSGIMQGDFSKVLTGFGMVVTATGIGFNVFRNAKNTTIGTLTTAKTGLQEDFNIFRDQANKEKEELLTQKTELLNSFTSEKETLLASFNEEKKAITSQLDESRTLYNSTSQKLITTQEQLKTEQDARLRDAQTITALKDRLNQLEVGTTH